MKPKPLILTLALAAALLSPATVAAADTTPPTVTISAPANGSSVAERGVVEVTFAATDDSALAQVDVTVNGTPLCSSLFYYAVTQTTCFWTAPKKPGAYTITATAHDGCTGDPANGGASCTQPWNVAATSVTVTVEKAPPPHPR